MTIAPIRSWSLGGLTGWSQIAPGPKDTDFFLLDVINEKTRRRASRTPPRVASPVVLLHHQSGNHDVWLNPENTPKPNLVYAVNFTKAPSAGTLFSGDFFARRKLKLLYLNSWIRLEAQQFRTSGIIRPRWSAHWTRDGTDARMLLSSAFGGGIRCAGRCGTTSIPDSWV